MRIRFSLIASLALFSVAHGPAVWAQTGDSPPPSPTSPNSNAPAVADSSTPASAGQPPTSTAQPPSGAATESSSATQLKEVTVTAGKANALGLDLPSSSASRLDISPLETPGTVSIISGETIRDRGDQTLLQAETQAPGVSGVATPGNGNSGLSYRGFTGVTAVMQLYDGLQLAVGAGTVTFPFDPWTVDRLEFLGGPESVLYGVGSVGGTVNVVSRKPNASKQQDEIQAGYGSFETWNAAVDSTGPITSNTAYRVDLSYNNSNGYVARGKSQSLASSEIFQFDVTPDLRLSVSNDFGFQKPMGYFGTPLINGVLDKSLRSENFNVQDATIRWVDDWTQFKTDWKPSNAVSVHNDFYVLTSYRHWHEVEDYTYQPSTGEVLRNSYIEIFHHELQFGDEGYLAYKGNLFGLANQVEVGFDTNAIRFEDYNNSPYSGSSSVDPYNFSPGYFINEAGTAPKYRTHTQESAIFAEDRLVLNQQLSLVVGARYDRAGLQYDNLAASSSSFDKKFYSPTWHAGAVYNPLPTLSLYGEYATGTAPLGSLISTSISDLNFQLSTGKQVEIGAKQSFWNSRGQWTLAAYHIIENKLLTPDPSNPSISEQVGEQSSEGLEAALGFALGGGWRVEGNGTILRARFDNFQESVSGTLVSFSGNVPPTVPLHAANLWVTWDIDRAWQLNSGVQYVGRRFADDANQLTMPAYKVVNAGLKWKPVTGLSLDLRVANAFDEIYAAAPYNSGTQWILGEPRSVSLTTNYKF